MISEKFSTNTESFNEFRHGRRIDCRFPVEVSIIETELFYEREKSTLRKGQSQKIEKLDITKRFSA